MELMNPNTVMLLQIMLEFEEQILKRCCVIPGIYVINDVNATDSLCRSQMTVKYDGLSYTVR